MSIERSQFSRLVVHKLLAHQEANRPNSAQELLQEIVALLDIYHDNQMKILLEIRDRLEQLPQGSGKSAD